MLVTWVEIWSESKVASRNGSSGSNILTSNRNMLH